MELGVNFTAMACPCEVRVVGDSEAGLQAAAQAAVAEVRRIQSRYSRYDPASVVSRINAAAGSGQPVAVDAETAGLLDFSAQLHTLSEGRYDITSGVLRRAWNFGSLHLPDAAQVQALLPLVGWQQVHWHDGCIALPLRGMEVDFGGFGKEYAADRAVAVLRQAGVCGGYVNLGGDIAVLGPRADGSPWRFALQHPRQPGVVMASLDLAQGGLATSGDYERCIVVDGRHYSHLLDARTGWPVQHWQSVSVVAPGCAAAGALCTLAMLLGEDATALLDSHGVDYLAVAASGSVVTGGALAV